MKKSKKDRETDQILAKHEKSLEKLRKENYELRKELNQEMLHSAILNKKSGSKIARLNDIGNIYAKKIKLEKHKYEILQKEIKAMQLKIKKKRKELLNPEGGDAVTLQKKIKNFTYKLDKAKQKNNEAVAYNKKLKNDIDALRNERKMFDNIYNNLKEELDKKKGELQDVIKKTKSVKEKREDAQEKLWTLKQLANIEQIEFEKVYQDVYKTLDAEAQVKHKEIYFDQLKELQRQDKEERKLRYGLIKEQPADTKTDFMTEIPDEAKPKETITEVKQTPEELQKQRQETLKKAKKEVEDYKKIFEKLKSDDLKNENIQNADQLVKKFQDLEFENDKQYRHINDLNDEKEELEKDIRIIDRRIEELETKKKMDYGKNMTEEQLQLENQRDKQIQELDKQITESDRKYEILQNEHGKVVKIIDTIKVGIPIIFQRIGCQLGDFQTELNVNESNMLQYMAIIENRTNEILEKYDKISAKLPKVEDDDQNMYQPQDSVPSEENHVKKQDNYDQYNTFSQTIACELFLKHRENWEDKDLLVRSDLMQDLNKEMENNMQSTKNNKQKESKQSLQKE